MPTYGPIEKKRGHPPRTRAQFLAARIWVYALFLATDIPMLDFARLENFLRLTVKRDGKITRPHYVDRCWNGKMGLDISANPLTLIHRVEHVVSSTACWPRNPLWLALDRTNMTSEEVTELMALLDPRVTALLLSQDEKANQGRKRLPFDATVVAKLAEIRSFDSLAAAVLLVRESEAIASPELRSLAISVYHALQPCIAQIPEIEPFYPELFSLIDASCKTWVYPYPNQRLDVVMFWQGLKDQVWNADDKKVRQERKKKKRTSKPTKKRGLSKNR